MGYSPYGQLSYGYYLGSDEDGWHIAELNEDGDWLPAWIDLEEDPDEDPTDKLEDRILMAIGFNATIRPDYADEPAYHLWRHTYEAARRTLGVEIGRCGFYDGMQTLLTTFHTSVEWGEFQPLDMAALEARRLAEDWDGKLDRVTDYLGISMVGLTLYEANRKGLDREPVRPGWLLTSWYG